MTRSSRSARITADERVALASESTDEIALAIERFDAIQRFGTCR